MQSYIKIGGLVPEKNGYNRQAFVVLYIGLSRDSHKLQKILLYIHMLAAISFFFFFQIIIFQLLIGMTEYSQLGHPREFKMSITG